MKILDIYEIMLLVGAFEEKCPNITRAFVFSRPLKWAKSATKDTTVWYRSHTPPTVLETTAQNNGNVIYYV